MKRLYSLCYRFAMGRWIAALALSVAFAATAYPQPGRLLPANGKLGDLGARQNIYPLIQIGSEVLRLAPGALIYDESNRTIVHAALPEHKAVLYVQDPAGSVMRVYILRPDELKRIKGAAQR